MQIVDHRQISGAQAMVQALEHHGVRHVFGLCGHTTIAVLAALERSPIRFVGVHHEQVAGHAADGYARVTGSPSVLLTHLGPGLTNALTGVANASLDRVPMIVITGNVQSYFSGRHAHMEVTRHGDADQSRAFAPFCKQIWTAATPRALLHAVDAAFRVCRAGVPGPVLVDVAMDAFSQLVEPGSAGPPPGSAVPPALDRDFAARAARLLAEAARPVLYAGSGVRSGRACRALVRLAEAANAPVAYSLLGKGCIPDDHELCLGVSGVWGHPAANLGCRQADLILAVGTRFSELDTSSWQPGVTFAIPPARLVHIDSDPDELGRSYRPELASAVDPALALEAILAAFPAGAGGGRCVLADDLAQARRSFLAELSEVAKADGMPMHPGRVLAELRAALPPDGRLVGDTGWNKNGVAQQWPASRPDDITVPGGYATMGFGPAAALGVALAEPGRPTLALVGDGAFLANPSVVLTAVEEQIPVVWAVMNNGTFATISGLQRRHYGTDYGSSFASASVDFVALARSMGAGGALVRRPDEVAGIAAAALAERAPFVIDIPCSDELVPMTGHWDINTLFATDPARAR